ncbi:DUF1853 family protein [Patiriisocius hiemis]|uniref:DUF1853 family protein n=1 Tax=Patiriisocius hiemis TaxID=3075604 RepID=A0ABU2YG52_9FLAO|nr:DUF1853 family protein [Constantimarinum sp. W242]MDT0556757.1 DUF1853 family protein [Constantimarinum sp. W242]
MFQLQHFILNPSLDLSKFENSLFSSFIFSEENIRQSTINIPENFMLGKQAEFLFESYLNVSKRYNIIASNIQIQGATETLGEIDYLVKDTLLHKTLHIELACKFYLFDGSQKDRFAKWIGPNRKDSLQEKVDKLTTKQFPILYKDETKPVLDKYGLNSSGIEQQLCLKAFLFIPEELKKDGFTSAFQKCIVGYWVNYNVLQLESNASYYIPSKREWLQPIASIKHWLDAKNAQKTISQSISEKRSPLVYKKTAQNVEQFFVVWW